jgi:hypothetical protein
VWWCPQCYTDLRPAKPTHQARHARSGPADLAIRADGRVTTDGDEATSAAEQMISRLASEHGFMSDPALALGQRFASRRSRLLLGGVVAAALTSASLLVFTLIGLLL